ncbi:MAG: DNA translocase FtsK 4TM domain-containing protein, partial [Elusimicrobiota bacterium]|nr:DNA translocase FtsK 4TM domain-containing protein [Elusimicrobiota bacterium]
MKICVNLWLKNMKRNDIRGFILLTVGVLFLWFLFYPQQAGVLGLYTRKYLLIIFGRASYIFPLIILWIGTKLLFNKKLNNTSLTLVSDILILWSLCTILSLSTADTPEKNFGGFIGKYSEIGVKKIIGNFGGWVFSFGVLIVSVFLTTGISFDDFSDFLSKLFKPRKRKLFSEPEERPKELPKVLVPKPVEIKKEEPAIFKQQKEPKIIKEKPKVLPEQVFQTKEKKRESSTLQDTVVKYELPSPELLDEPKKVETQVVEEELRDCADKLIKTLADFDISATIDSINPGPVITRYDIILAPGTKVNSITNLSNDIALTMKTESIRVLAPIPGKSAVGIEIPNPKQAIVGIKDIITSKKFMESKSLLNFAIGKTTAGEPFCDDLAPMPHLLIAGSTG